MCYPVSKRDSISSTFCKVPAKYISVTGTAHGQAANKNNNNWISVIDDEKQFRPPIN